jgi:hypothetical protein
MEIIKGEMNDRNALLYLSQEQAEKLAKLLTRAVELCGGENEELPTAPNRAAPQEKFRTI